MVRRLRIQCVPMPNSPAKARLNPQEVCDLLGVTMYALRKWRSPKRLKLGTADPLYLPATPDPADPRIVWYAREDVLAFCRRNDRYEARFLAAFAPDDALASLYPTPTQPLPGLFSLANQP